MNLAACRALARGPENRVWYRAIQPKFWQTALQTEQTTRAPSRYNAGSLARRPFEVLYLAEDHQVALYEVGAMMGPCFPKPGRVVVPNPKHSWTILNVRVQLQRVADLTRVSVQKLLCTSAQELTGDWEGYQERTPEDTVSEPVGVAPTQALGGRLFAVPRLEGFRTISARLPGRMILVVFPQKLLKGSMVEFWDDLGKHHRLAPRPTNHPRR